MATRPTNLVPFTRGSSEMPRLVPASVLVKSLAASTAEAFTVPTGSTFVVFSSNVDVYVNCYTTATVPGDVTDGAGSELNPAGYQLPADITSISVISASAGIVTAAFYS